MIKLSISIFKVHDPEKQKFSIKKREGSSIQFDRNWDYRFFGDCILIANELNIDISKYRGKIISYIRYAHDPLYNRQSGQLEAIFSLLQKFNNDEIGLLLKIYGGKRKDDLAHFYPKNFVDAIDKYKIVEAIPILKGFVNKGYDLHIRRVKFNCKYQTG